MVACGVPVFTVGHSTRSLEDFLRLLEAHSIEAVADVRRFPASRRHPHFARQPLERSLAEPGVSYRWLPGLGGRRPRKSDSPHASWREPGFAGYAGHMDTEEFRSAAQELMALAEVKRTALMCAEAVPERCHRRLISDWLLLRGFDVRHILDLGPPRAHVMTPFARVEGGRIYYDQ